MREKWHDDMEDDSEKAMGVFVWLGAAAILMVVGALGVAVAISLNILF